MGAERRLRRAAVEALSPLSAETIGAVLDLRPPGPTGARHLARGLTAARENNHRAAGVDAVCIASRHLACGLILANALLSGSIAEAADTVVVGFTGPPTAMSWPFE